jgi:hypothetical protein
MRLVKPGADGDGAVRINGAIPLLDVLDFSFLVNHHRGALRPFELAALDIIRPQDAVRSQHFLVHIAQQREGNADLLSKSGVGGGAVQTNSENNGVACFEFGQISLIGLKFFRSTTCECQDVEGKHDVLLAAKIA